MKKIYAASFVFSILLSVITVGCGGMENDVSQRTRQEENPVQTEEEISIEIIDKKMDIKGLYISVPQILGDTNTVQNFNKIIIKKIEEYIDEGSSVSEYHYTVQCNDGRYVSIIIEIMRNLGTSPYPGSQAYAINLDVKEKKLLDNDDLVPNPKKLCEDIKNGKYILLPEDEIPKNVAYPSGYIENKEIDEIEKMYMNKELEIFISSKSLGFIVVMPHAMGDYAIFERVD